MVIQERNAGLYLPSAFNNFPTCFLGVCRATFCPHGHSNDCLESNTEIDKAADSTNIPLYVLKRANSWTRFSVTLQLCSFIEILAIVLVGVQ